MTRPAVFLDKDGTLVENVPYNVDCARLRLTAGAGEALRTLHEQGFALVVVTNQAGVALGYFTEEAVLRVRDALQSLLQQWDVRLTGFFYCPHLPTGTVARYARLCECRKPLPGMLLSAAREFDLDLSRSWMVGDILHDVEAGHRAECRAILMDNGGETEWDMRDPRRRPDYIASDLVNATRYIAGADQLNPWNSSQETYCHAGQS